MKLESSLQDRQNLSVKRLKLQWRVVKWPVRGWLAAALALIAAACAPRGESGVSPVAGWNGDESPAYRSGHADGSRDKRGGRPYAPASAPAASSESYAQGYAAGYKSPHDNPWSRHRAYQLGEARGRGDRESGGPKDPEGRSAEVPRAVRGDFRRGYEAAWN